MANPLAGHAPAPIDDEHYAQAADLLTTDESAGEAAHVKAVAQALANSRAHWHAVGWGEGWERGVQMALDVLDSMRWGDGKHAAELIRERAIDRGMRPEALR